MFNSAASKKFITTITCFSLALIFGNKLVVKIYFLAQFWEKEGK